MPGAIAPELDRELQAWTRRVQAFAHDAFGEKLRRLRVRLEDKEAIAALHWRGDARRGGRAGRDRGGRRGRPRRPASSPTGAARCSRSARRCGSTRAPGSSACCGETDLAAAVYVGDDITDLDAFRGLSELQERGRLGYAVRVGVRSDETPVRAAGGGRHDRGRARGRARTAARAAALRFGDFLKATVLLSAASATLLAALTVIGAAELDRDTAVYVCVGWWIVATRDRLRAGRRATRPRTPIARLLASAKHQHSLPDLHPARTIVNRLWPLLIVHARRRRAVGLRAPDRRRSPPASRSSGRSPGAARRPPWRRSRSATARASTSTARRRSARSG